MKTRRIVFNGKGDVGCETLDLGSPGLDEVLVQTTTSLISTGTENIIFNRLFEAGTAWDSWIKYPFYPGYAAIGIVQQAGGNAKDFKPGDRVACRCGHASAHIVPAASCFKVPDGVSDEDAAWFALAKIAAMGARVADHKLGETLVVVGAGPIGQMAIRWAAAAGAGKIICVDPYPLRLELACKGGADYALGMGISEAVSEISRLTDEAMADTVVDTTGHPAVFVECFKAVRKFGKIVILGDTGMPSKQCLSHDVMNKGITIVAAHDSHENPAWDSKKIISLLFHLSLKGRFPLEGLVTHRFKPDRCREAYETAGAKRNETLGILFTWET